jgi:hypothetical protein
MHGTFVNQKKIPVDHDVTIRNGDILMFGNEVTRGSGESYAISSRHHPGVLTARPMTQPEALELASVKGS